ncbi:MAG: FHA domain protein [Chloroflexi bacterium ADurb.Bin360]|nr:MAG: FHA domain protein [Chloroflexi bacterium ADurb.Bin360]
MKRTVTASFGLFCAIVLLVCAVPGLAQAQKPPLLFVLDTPVLQGAEGVLHVAVVDPNTGKGMSGLEGSFEVNIAGEPVVPQVEAETAGLAVAIVIDRGGISRPGDPRLGHALDLSEQLLQQLQVDGSENADLVSFIGIAELDKPENWSLAGFTDYDPQLIRNEFETIRGQAINGVTPLFNGIDQAVEWMIHDAGVSETDTIDQEDLNRRRRVIVVFSDGIDNKFSDRAHQLTLIQKCRENGIILYTVRLEHSGRATGSATLEVLASETYGRFERHLATDDAVRAKVLSMFSDLITQRNSYRLTFPFRNPKGSYDVNIKVTDAALGNAQAQTRISSNFQLPQIAMTSPQNGLQVTVPYTGTQDSGAYLATTVSFQAALTFPDGVTRDITRVRYYADLQLVGESTTAPDFAFVWDVSSLTVAAAEPQTHTYTLTAEATDPLWEQRFTSEPVSMTVVWQPTPPPTVVESSLTWLELNWWLLLVLAGLLIGLVVLFILNARMKGELGRKIRAGTTGVLKGVTRPLSALSAPAQGKLVVVQGAGMGKEFRLSGQVSKIGRDPQFCDFALYDEFVSNPHFNVYLDQGNYYIEDTGSRNQTRLNGTIIPPNQRQFLQPDAIIEVGATRLQFKRLGGNTRQLQQPGMQQPGMQQPGMQPGAPAAYPQTPPASPPGMPGWGGPTQAVPEVGLPPNQPYSGGAPGQPAPGGYSAAAPQNYPPTQMGPGGYPPATPQNYPPTQMAPGSGPWGQLAQPPQQPPSQPVDPNQRKP